MERKHKLAAWLAAAGRLLGQIADDLLLTASGVCFTAAAWELAGRPGALVAAGIFLAVYAALVARAGSGGDGT